MKLVWKILNQIPYILILLCGIGFSVSAVVGLIAWLSRF